MGDKPEIPEGATQQQEPSAPERDDRANRRAGTLMIIATWVVLLGMLTGFAQRWYETKYKESVSLQATSNGHYYARGLINDFPVIFILDTGATWISIPAGVATGLALQPGDEKLVHTANGSVTVQNVTLTSVAIGGLELRNVSGHINPHMSGDEVLLGMSYLRHFDLVQRGSLLTLSEP